MKITAQTLPNSRRHYKVELTEIETAEFYERAAKKLAETVKVTGFRPGKAPMNLVREQLKPEALREEAYSLAVHDAWVETARQLKELPIEDPAVDVDEFSEGKKATLEFQFDVRPEVKIKDWQKISVSGVKKPATTEKDIDEVIESLRKGHAQTIIKLEPTKEGDKIEVTFDGYLANVKKDKLSSKHFPIVLGEKSVIPGFAEELVGLKKNDKKTFTLKFPKDHFDKELAGQSVKFEIVIDEVFSVVLPAVNDEFGKKFGHDTIAQLKKAIRDDLEKERGEELFTQQKAKWLEEFEKKITLELPKSLVEAEVNRARQSWLDFLASRNLQPDQWLSQRGMKLEDLEKDWQKAAATSVTIGLGLATLAQEQKRSLNGNDDYQQFLDELVNQALEKSTTKKSD